MSDLLKLVKFCLNDKDFYLSKSKKKSIKRYFVDDYGSDAIRCDIDFDSIQPTIKNKYILDLKSKMYQSIRKTFDLSKRLSPESCLEINFEDQPPINIFDAFKVNESKPFDAKFTIDKKFPFFKKEIEYTFNYVANFVVKKYYISCGSIKEEITHEQFLELVKLFEDNKKILREEADREKISKRLSNYQ